MNSTSMGFGGSTTTAIRISEDYVKTVRTIIMRSSSLFRVFGKTCEARVSQSYRENQAIEL